jgi:hypothetical protein
VWDLYRAALARFGAVPTLVEWDTDLPPLDVLLDEAARADAIAATAGQGVVADIAVAPIDPAPAADLDVLQQTFGAALFDSAHDAALSPLLKGDPRRVGIYRGNLHAHWTRALASAYPVLRQLVGDEFFDALARVYGREHPAVDPDLNRFGAALPDFLAGFTPAADHPYLPDVARLEWCVHEAWFAPDADAAPAAFTGLAPDAFEAARAVLHPSLRLHASPWATVALWRAHQADGPDFPDDIQAQTHALVLRPRFDVEVEVIGEAEFAALACLARGDTFGAALDAAFDVDEDFDVAMHLRRWLDRGMVAGIKNGENAAP